MSYVCVFPMSPAFGHQCAVVMTLEVQDGHNPLDRRRVLLRLLHTRCETVIVGAQVGDRLGTETDHVGRGMLHHRLDRSERVPCESC